MSLKRFLLIGLLVLSSTLIFAGGTGEKDKAKGKILIGEIIYSLEQPYQQAHAKNAQEYAKKLGIDIIIVDGKGSAEAIATGFENLIAKGVKGIIAQPADAESVNVSVEEALSKNIAVVTFFNKPTKAISPFVKLEEHAVAEEMGAFAAKKWKEFHPETPVKIGILNAPKVAYVKEHRAAAFVTGVMKADPTAELVADLDGEGLREKSYQAAEDMLQSHPEVNVIYGINADAVLGGAAAFEAAGRGKAVGGVPQTEIFCGTDGTEAEILKIADPKSSVKVTMALSPKSNAEVLIDTLMKVINGQLDKRADFEVKSNDFIIDGWSMNMDKLQEFLTIQYFSKTNLKEVIK